MTAPDRPTGFVRTVLGDVTPEELGRTDYHEHLFQVSPLLPGDELDDEELSGEEAAALVASGLDAMVDATPLGLGRDPAAIARVSRLTGLRVVMTTGVHRREHYGAGHPLLEADEAALAAAFVRDLTSEATEGLAPAGAAGTVEATGRGAGGRVAPVPRAGLLKAGLGYWRIEAHAARVIAAIGRAHAVTGAPVMVHLEHGSAGHEVLERLAAAGVPADAVALAHVDRNPDPGLHAELASAGAYLGYDGWARHREWPDSALLACLVDVAGAGHADRLLLGGDVARRTRYRAYGGIPGIGYLGERVVPRLVREAGEALVDTILRENPARWLTWR